MKIPEAYRSLARKARKQGWTITMTGGTHLAWRSPAGAVIYTPSSPSESRGYRNARAQGGCARDGGRLAEVKAVRKLAEFCEWLGNRLGFWRIDVIWALAQAQDRDKLAAQLESAGLSGSAAHARQSAARWRERARLLIPKRAPEKWRKATV